MSLDAPAEIVPYSRFLDVRQRRREGATGSCTPEPVAPLAPVVVDDVNVLSAQDAPVENAVVTASVSVVSGLSW